MIFANKAFVVETHFFKNEVLLYQKKTLIHSTYTICNVEVEQQDHLKCEVAARTWFEIFKWLEISQIPFDSVPDLFMLVDQLPIASKKKVVLDTVV